MNSVPNLATTPHNGEAVLTTASGAAELGTSLPSQLVSLFVAAVGGSYVRRWRVLGRNGALNPCAVRLFKKVGSAYYLQEEHAVPSASAPSATQAAYDSGWITLDRNLESGEELHVCTTVTQNLVVEIEGADYAA